MRKSKGGSKLLMAIASILLLFSLCLSPPEDDLTEKELRVYVGACMEGAVSEIADLFESENPGVRIKIVAKGSGGLLDNIGGWRDGDVFMPGEESFAREAVDKGYMDAYTPAAYHRLTIIVPEGNPGGIKSLEDITDDSIRVVAGGYDIAMGRMLLETIGKTPIYEEIRDNYVYLEESKCSRIPMAVAEKQADVGISCKPSALHVKGVYVMDIPEFSKHPIPIGILKFSEDRKMAQNFVDFVKSDAGSGIMAKYGFEPI